MGGRIIDDGRLVDVYIQTIVRAHLQRCLDSGLGKLSCVFIIGSLFHFGRDLRQTAFHIVVFLGFNIPGNPPGQMVSGHTEFGVFFFDGKISKSFLGGEFIAETQAVIIQAETHYHHHVSVLMTLSLKAPFLRHFGGLEIFLHQSDRKFVVIVAYV